MKNQKGSEAHLNPLTFIREDRCTVFPMLLEQDAEVFAAQGIFSSGAATDVVVFVDLTIDVLEKCVSL
jgi:hypothetical protein